MVEQQHSKQVTFLSFSLITLLATSCQAITLVLYHKHFLQLGKLVRGFCSAEIRGEAEDQKCSEGSFLCLQKGSGFAN